MLIAALLFSKPAWPAPESTPPSYPTESQVVVAVAKLKTDPNLAATRKMHMLRWAGQAQKPPGTLPGWMRWIWALFMWLAEAGRVLLWVGGALVVGLLALYIARLIRGRREREAAHRFKAPSHVRDLDIRPETLPDDIGAAALAAWERGEHRAALALLYRGLLSRLVHVHGVPIRHSSTEGECVGLAARHLPLDRAAYVSGLVRLWQQAVYGGQDPQTEEVRAVCAGFAPALDPEPSSSTSDTRVAGQAA
jgi:hypothetical protein